MSRVVSIFLVTTSFSCHSKDQTWITHMPDICSITESHHRPNLFKMPPQWVQRPEIHSQAVPNLGNSELMVLVPGPKSVRTHKGYTWWYRDKDECTWNARD